MPYTQEELETNKRCYERAAESYFERSQIYEKADRALLGHFMYLLGLKRNVDILDLGIGTGRRAELLSEVGPVTGIDFCEKFVLEARAKSIRCYHGEFSSFDFCGKTYDGIHCASFLHLFKDEDIPFILNKIKNLLVYRGILFIGEPMVKEDKGWVKEAKDLHSQEYRYHNVHTKEWWLNELEKAGFKCLSFIGEVDVISEGKFWWNGVWMRDD